MNKINILVTLIFFIAVGFFLRSYNFSEWLRFNADQARDTRVAFETVAGNEIPLLGPMAGGTDFKLGPIFYYFQIVSVKFFGNHPGAAAYPDLLFSVLSIPLFFLLARIFFNQKISLAVTWLYVISYFMIKYGRFAWNPNSTPFFVMLYLYAFFKSVSSREDKKKWWAILCGLALGANVQLHTSLLIILPLMTIVLAVFFFKKKKINLKLIAFIIAAAFVLNIPQIISEVKTGGLNALQFITGVTEKSGRNESLAENVVFNVTCHVKANSHIISGLGSEEECGYGSDIRMVSKLDSRKVHFSEKAFFVLLSIFSVIFSIGGYTLLGRKLKSENDENKKVMLIILSSYVGISFLFFITWATELSVRFFLGLSFVPFLLLGFWLEFISERFKNGIIITLAFVFALSFFNIQQVYTTFKDLNWGGREINGNFDYATLGEENFIIDFLKENSDNEKTLYLDAQAGYLFKMLRPLQFLAEKDELTLVQLEKEIELKKDARLFYIKSAENKCKLPLKTLSKYSVEKCSTHGQFSIFSLRVK